jgi:hypothetical protein
MRAYSGLSVRHPPRHAVHIPRPRVRRVLSCGEAEWGSGGKLDCDTRSHVVSELVEEVWLMPGTWLRVCVRPVPAVTCVAGSCPAGCGAHGKAQGPPRQPWRSQVRGRTGGATAREPLLMPRHFHSPGWVALPGWQGPAVERRQAAATDPAMASGYRRPRGIEGARPGPGLMRAERGNLAKGPPGRRGYAQARW